MHINSVACKVRRMSLVDNVNINQDGGTSAAFDINVQVEVKDVVGDNLVPETEYDENSVDDKGISLEKVKNIKCLCWGAGNKGCTIN